MTEKELDLEILKKFKKLIDVGDVTFPSETLKEYYNMTNKEEDEDEFKKSNEFWFIIRHFKLQMMDELNENDCELFFSKFYSTNKIIELLYTNKDQII